MNALHTLLATEITPENQAELNTEVEKHKVEITRLREEIAQEATNLADTRNRLTLEASRIQAEAAHLNTQKTNPAIALQGRHAIRL